MANSRDSSTVSLENEMMQLSQNTMTHTLETQMVSGMLMRLKMAITGVIPQATLIQPLSGIQNTVAALDAERMRLDIISENIANANTTHGIDGKPYQRKVVVFETALQQAMGPGNNGSMTSQLRIAHRQGCSSAREVMNPAIPTPIPAAWSPRPISIFTKKWPTS